MMGTGRYLKEQKNEIQLIAFQPDSPFHGLEGMKHMPTSIVPGIYDDTLADSNQEVSTEDAQNMVQRLAREEGLMVGVSAGAAMVVAMRVAGDLDAGLVVTIFPDSAAKYLSEEFWKEK